MADAKRIGLGLITSIAILLLLDMLPSLIPNEYAAYRILDHFYVWPGVGGMISMFVAAFGGAYVSKTRFLVPAALLAVGVWIFISYFLNLIAAVAGHDNFFHVASVNLLGLIFGVIGALLGAHAGARVADGFRKATS